MNSKIKNQSQNNKKFQLQTQNHDHYNNIKRIKKREISYIGGGF